MIVEMELYMMTQERVANNKQSSLLKELVKMIFTRGFVRHKQIAEGIRYLLFI